MRAVQVGFIGLGALLAGCVAIGCSSNAATSDDGGIADDAFVGSEDAFSQPDTSVRLPGTDAGDATLSQGDSSVPPGDDAGDSSPASDAGTDSSDGATPGNDAGDAGDSSAADASDGSSLDASDAGDASLADASDAAWSDDASDAASTDAADAASEDAGEDASEDAADGAAFDAAALCSGFNLAGDAINGITATTSPGGTALNIVTTDPSQNQIPDGSQVIVTATTSPIGVMEDISIGYFTSASATNIFVPMTLVPTSGGTNQEWQGTIPAVANATQVSFWVVGHDYCKTDADAGADYYSNGGSNYHYETQ
jgi:hypothetical protein